LAVFYQWMLVQHRLHPLYSQNKKRREDAFRSGALQVPEKKNKQEKNRTGKRATEIVY
jgi:hypothetical protein